ncbi:MAG: sugar MFS transporter [Bacteroidetes bacterium]|nr:sugar MFS transporter [Bacteroidota bacterium]MCC6655137.1 sugar MFS transporter [Flavobacteriales bacterium]HMU13109.1 sugar MFS transporter [Flavobacteriales bacterium]HNO04310.1 sugar MFS transporter [Flavobacteriales bacterium]
MRSNTSFAILIIGFLFFIFGFVTWLNGPLIPFMRIACELTDFEASMVVPFAFYISYFVMALPSALVLRRTGMKNGMVLGLLIMALGAFLFIPAAKARSAGIFLTGFFTIGTGLALLQTASNPYVTVVGPISSAARRISIMGICNKVGGIVAPPVLGSLILVNADKLKTELASLEGPARGALLDERAALVVMPYTVLGLGLIAAAIFIRLTPLPPIAEDTPTRDTGHASVWKHPQLILGVIALFVYVWAEVLAGDSIPIYAERLGTPLDTAKVLTSLTLSAMLLGYIAGIITIPKYLSQAKALAASCAVALLCVAGIVLSDPGSTATVWMYDFNAFAGRTVELPITVICVALLGLGNALMWPAIWPLAVDGIGGALRTGSAMLIMAILGGALALPVWTAMSPGASVIASQNAYLLLLPFYLYIGWYAMRGHLLRAKAAQ